MPVLYTIRGHSGSGKSTYAKNLDKPHHFEADMYFIDEKGVYRHDPELLKEAHQWCHTQVEKAMETKEAIVVSNTFIKKNDVRPYLDLARRHGYKVRIIRCTGDYENLHGVPGEKVEFQKRMYQSFDSEIKV